MNAPRPDLATSGDRPVSALMGDIETAIPTVLVKSLESRDFGCRLLRQQGGHVGRLASSDDVLLVYHCAGPALVERWYENSPTATRSGPGDVTVLPNGRASGWRLPEPVEVLHLYVPGELVARVAERDFEADSDRVEILDSFASDDATGAALAQAALTVLSEEAPRDGLLLDALAQAVAVHLLRRHAVLPSVAARAGEQPNALSPERLRRVRDYIEAHLGDELTLDKIADAASLSTYHLSRCFRRATGETLHGYVMVRRTERAKAMLERRGLTLAQIAYCCGFASQSHFNAAFKRQTGVTPGRYRGGRASAMAE